MKKVLIVEDDADTLDLMEIILRKAGYGVIKANREVTVKEIAGIKPHLVILDYLLPFGLRTEKCFEIKTNALTADIPAILYSASKRFEKYAAESTADAFIGLPHIGDRLAQYLLISNNA
ncbi:MAG TPA: hypothetical protein VHS53_05640 [Mucilaginibacter sp.]|nr:hypothetical protein [Mucilaginibacter sp.]